MKTEKILQYNYNYFLMVMVLCVLSFGAAQCQSIRIDPSMNAFAANDMTAIIEGCGKPPIVGYTYCRMTEGTAANHELTLKVPKSDCDRTECAFYEFISPQGQPAPSGSFEKGKTSVKVLWSDLIGRDHFTKDDRGMWGVRIRWYWIGSDKKEYSTVQEGEVRMRVLPPDYHPLHEEKDSPFFSWKWSDESGRYAVSTAGRAWAGK